MIQTHEKFHLVDPELRSTNIFWEVNWNPKDDKTNQCKIIKMTLPDGTVSFISRKTLLEILFAIGKPGDQQKMIPQTLETIHHYKTVLGVKANKDIAKGEMINFPIELSVPCAALSQDTIGSLPVGAKEMTKNGRLVL